jgi:hypothetical protein
VLLSWLPRYLPERQRRLLTAERQSLEELRNTVVNLLQALVEQRSHVA